MVKFSSTRRDLIFFALLVIMIKIAVNRKTTPEKNMTLYAPAEQLVASMIETAYDTPNDLQSFNTNVRKHAEKQNTEDDISEELSPAIALDQESEEVVHQPDEHLMYQLNALSDQLSTMLAFINPVAQEAAQLKSIRLYLSKLKRKYQHTSPAIALLGPIGTIGIVAKELELEKELFKVAQRLVSILEKITKTDNNQEKPATVLQAIEYNKNLFAKLAKRDEAKQEA